LLDRGDTVSVFNRGSTQVRVQGELEFLTGNRWESGSLENAVHGRTWDAVIDMAAFAPANGQQLRETFWGHTAQVVVCSTCCVYGGPAAELPIKESSPRSPFGMYGVNKAAIEDILLESNGKQGTHATIIRPSYTTGEGATASGLLFDDSLVSRMRQGLPNIVMDDGTCPWAITHVSDVARGFVNALGNTKAYGNDYHLTSDEHTDWNGVYQAMARAAGVPSTEIVHVPSEWLRAQAPRRSLGVWFIYRFPSVYDNAKACRDLDFRTTISLEETFRRQIQWMESQGRLISTEQETCQDCLLDAWNQRTDLTGRSDWNDWNPWGNSTEN
jgi:nucleoside-diphosphate-sugar epimerase